MKRLLVVACCLLSAVVGCASSAARSGEPSAGGLDDVPAAALAGLADRTWTCPLQSFAPGQRLAYDLHVREGSRVVEADDDSSEVAPFTLERALRFEYEVTAAPVTSAQGATVLRVRLTRLEQRGPRAAELQGLEALLGAPFTLRLDPSGAPFNALVGPAIEASFGKEAALTGAGLGADAAGLLQWAKEPFVAVPRERPLVPGDHWIDARRELVYRYLGTEEDGDVRLLVEPHLDPEGAREREWLVRPVGVVRLTADGVPVELPELRWATQVELQSQPGHALQTAGTLAISLVADAPR